MNAVVEYIDASVAALLQLNAAEIAAVARATLDVFRRGNKLMLCGNGGSAADAAHIAAEFVGRFAQDRRALPAIALGDNIAALTAIANDYEYLESFARHVVAFAQPDDMLWCFTTSGRSQNVLRAAEAARDLGLKTVGFTGLDRPENVDHLFDWVIAAGGKTPFVQQASMVAAHAICGLVEEALFG